MPSVKASSTMDVLRMGGSEETQRNCQEHIQRQIDEQRESTRQMLSNPEEWPDVAKEKIQEMAGGCSLSNEELTKVAMAMLDEIPDESLVEASRDASNRGRLRNQTELTFLERTHTLLPPFQQCRSVLEVIHGLDARDEGTVNRMMEQALDIVHDTWVTNPIMFDPLWETLGNGTIDMHEFDPINEFISLYITDATTATMKEPPLASLDKPTGTLEFFDYTSRFYWSAAYSLKNLAMKNRVLCLEWNVGGVTDLCRTMQDSSVDRRGRGWPTKFQRIFASNIPDYVGMLSFFTEVIPVLEESTEDVSTFMHTNILLNTGIWKDYAHYIYSSTAIPELDQVTQILGVQCTSGNSVWADNDWTWAKSSLRATKEDIRLWLHRLFFNVILPAERDPNNMIREVCPQTIVTFLRTCNHCVQVLRYPTHWIAGVLDELLCLSGKRQLKTIAQVPQTFPNAFEEEEEIRNINVSSFLLEFCTHVTIWMNEQTFRSGLMPLETLKLPTTPVFLYELEAGFVEVSNDPKGHTRHGIPFVSCLGAVLEPKKRKEEEIPGMPGDNEMFDMFGQMMKDMMQMMKSKGQSIRNDVLTKGADCFQILSCVEWTYYSSGGRDRNCLRFVMPQSMFEARGCDYVSILRTDGWYRVGKPIQLRRARRVDI